LFTLTMPLRGSAMKVGPRGRPGLAVCLHCASAGHAVEDNDRRNTLLSDFLPSDSPMATSSHVHLPSAPGVLCVKRLPYKGGASCVLRLESSRSKRKSRGGASGCPVRSVVHAALMGQRLWWSRVRSRTATGKISLFPSFILAASF